MRAKFEDVPIEQAVGIEISGPDCCADCRGHYHESGEPRSNLPQVRITRLEREEAGWYARGLDKVLPPHGESARAPVPCPMCGNMYGAIMRVIPIECVAYECPMCGADNTLRYDMLAINRNSAAGFDFEVAIVCNKCSRRDSFVKLVEHLAAVSKLEITLAGVKLL